MQFLTNAPDFDLSFKSAENYPSGHIFKKDGSPAVFVVKNKIDLGLKECRSAIIQEMHVGNGTPAKIYSEDQRSIVDLKARSILVLRSRDEHLRAAYNALDMGFRDRVLPNCKCSFDLSPNFEIHARQQLMYQPNDHFSNRNGQHNAHADDSLFVNGKWVRNDIRRHFVGLLYLSDHVEKVEDENTQFSGGHLEMPLISENGKDPYIFKPKYGTILYFPASPLYLHGVPKITDGNRIVVTTWFTLENYI